MSIKTREEADELAAKTRMALAEAGYPDGSLVGVAPKYDPLDGWEVRISFIVPGEVAWQAGRILGRPMPCLACWKRDHHGNGLCRERGVLDCGLSAS